jgi:hypothetical protein
LEKHNSEEAISTGSKQEESLSKLNEKKPTAAGANDDILDNFGFNEDIEREEDVSSASNPAAKDKKMDTLLVQKATTAPVVLSVDKPLVKISSGAAKGAKFESPIRMDAIKIITTKPGEAKNAPPEKPSPSEPKLKFTEVKSTPKMVKPMGTTTSGDRKLGIDVKNMKFSISKRVSHGSTPEPVKKVPPKKTTPNIPVKPAKPAKTVSAEEKDLVQREAALAKREQKNRALDQELDERASMLKVREAKLDRLQRMLKEKENALNLKEKRSRWSQVGDGGEGGSQEDDLSEREEQLRERERDLLIKEQQLESVEKHLQGLRKELAEKLEKLESKEPESKGVKQERMGLFERLADLGVDVGSDKRKAAGEEEEEAPPKKKSRKEEPKPAECRVSL